MKMETGLVTCVVCPKGCSISVDYEIKDNEKVITSVRGNSCKRGLSYASSEVIHPERVLSSTVRINHSFLSLLPVRSASPLPRELLFEAMKVIKQTKVSAPVKMGDVIIPNIAGSGIDMIACRDA